MNFARQTSSSASSPTQSPSSPLFSSAASPVESGSEVLLFCRESSNASSSAAAAPDSSSSVGSASPPPISSSAIQSDSSTSASNSVTSQSISTSQSTSTQISSSAPSSAPPSSSSVPPSSSAPPQSISSTVSVTFQSLTASPTNTTTSFASTTSFTTITTSVDGKLTTITSAVPPTSLSTAGSSTTPAQRTAIIAGATAAAVGVILLLLGALFVYKRHKGRKLEFSEAIGRVRREAHGAGGVGLLDDEGFDDDDVPMRRYRDNAISHSPTHSRSMNTSATSLGPPQSPAPSLFRQRAETGSLFREEGVWPPPQATHFVDPLVGVGTGESLTRIVDDIMGPPSYDPAAPTHALVEPAHRGTIPSMSSATSSLYADPFRDVSHSTTASDNSLYYDRRGASSSMSSNTQHTASRPTTPQSLLGLPAGAAQTPKKSSPLASTNPPTSATWLTRSPKKHALSGSLSSTEG
ncbi:hypothetical protein B0H11DRAFT_885553 [Mycena galericulata]|nr:hypothetical protein B0H11DRAFT_885553 [Mycena galericulata]